MRERNRPYAAGMTYGTYTEDENDWTWRNRKHPDVVQSGRLELYWEVRGDTMSDDYLPSEVDAYGLLELWLRTLPDEGTESVFGPGTVGISWGVWGTATEFAPFQIRRIGSSDGEHDFLTHFTWPEHTQTGERLNFNRLPVMNKLWGVETRGEKGGFIQEATGWKPSPLQPVMWVGSVLEAAGLDAPTWQPRRIYSH